MLWFPVLFGMITALKRTFETMNYTEANELELLVGGLLAVEAVLAGLLESNPTALACARKTLDETGSHLMYSNLPDSVLDAFENAASRIAPEKNPQTL